MISGDRHGEEFWWYQSSWKRRGLSKGESCSKWLEIRRPSIGGVLGDIGGRCFPNTESSFLPSQSGSCNPKGSTTTATTRMYPCTPRNSRPYERLIHHWFQLIRPAMKPLFSCGDALGGGVGWVVISHFNKKKKRTLLIQRIKNQNLSPSQPRLRSLFCVVTSFPPSLHHRSAIKLSRHISWVLG